MTRLIFNPYHHYYYILYEGFTFKTETETAMETEVEMGDDRTVITGNKAKEKKEKEKTSLKHSIMVNQYAQFPCVLMVPPHSRKKKG